MFIGKHGNEEHEAEERAGEEPRGHPPGLPSVRRLTARFAASLSSLAEEEELQSITARSPTTRWRLELSRARPALTDSVLRNTAHPLHLHRLIMFYRVTITVSCLRPV